MNPQEREQEFNKKIKQFDRLFCGCFLSVAISMAISIITTLFILSKVG